jgi:multidrug efflux system outer membrane protein
MNSLSKIRVGVSLLGGAGLCAVLFSSCAVGPDYHRPEVSTPTAFKRALPAEKAQAPISRTWWTLFNDPQLTSLAEKTIAANQDIQAGVARVEQARAALGVARGDYYPSINLNPSMRRGRSAGTGFSATGISSGGTTTGTTTNRGRISTSFSLPLALNYEFDLWGRIRRQVEFYTFSEEASEADLEFVRQTAVADVATSYFSIRLYDTQIGIYQRSLELYRRQLELTETKFKAGLALQTDVLQAQTQVNSATAQVLEVQRSRAREEHAIATLLGLAPSDFALETKELPLQIPVVPAGVPASLLNQRPDVANAERRLAAANAQIGVAQAEFYPSFSLTGSAGFESSRYQNLTDWSNRVWSIGPGLSLPIFQGGRLRGTLEERRASYRELVANYRSAVLTAYRDVEDELSDLHLLAQKADVLNATVQSAREYSRLTELQYRQGISSYLQVIDANQTLLNNELSAAQAQNQRLSATVLLIKALGGGWEGKAEG